MMHAHQKGKTMAKKKLAPHASEGVEGPDNEVSSHDPTTPEAPTQGPSCVTWEKVLEIVRKLRRYKKMDSFLEDWRNGKRKFTIEPEELIDVAERLIVAFEAAGVRPSKWPSAPTGEQLRDLDEWIAACVANVETKRSGYESIVDRALGIEQAPTGQINPVYLQKLSISREKFFGQLRALIARHREENDGVFHREWLDHKSKKYIKVKDGGISNKQITIMACEIAGQKPRLFEDSFKIVLAELAKLDEPKAAA
jgi:hypothetical protein